MRKITIEQFSAELKEQGVKSIEHCAFRCPMCKTIQSSRSLIHAGAGGTFEQVQPYLGFSCVGRFTNAGPHKPGAEPGRGCNWTLGGLFTIHELTVITVDGKEHMRFELATPEEAQKLQGELDALYREEMRLVEQGA